MIKEFILGLIIALISLVYISPQSVSAAVPEGFEKTLISDALNQPTSFAFAPDGRIFISEKTGTIKIIEDGHLHSDPLITLVVLDTHDAEERGLLGIEIDPDFATNGYIYVAYTTAQNLNRLSRFTVVGDSASPSSEVVLLESPQPADIFHHGGEIKVGPDGKIWWALGINTFNPNGQDLTTLHGKLLRINKDGSIPTDNPFYNTPNARKEIWTYGLRNPFRFTFLPNGKPIVGDVGGSSWEEVNVIEKGGNYGWPNVEGICFGCPYANPIFAYPHNENGGAITSAHIYSGTDFPLEYQGAFFYGDYAQQFVRYLRFDDQYSSVLSDNVFDNAAGTVVKLEQGPDGSLYQLNIFPGAIYKISVSDGNLSPIAQASADPIAGVAPLTVQFSSEGSEDPEGEDLTFLWDFGDDTTSTQLNPSHIYEENGTYTVILTVNDGEKTAQKSLNVTVGNQLPTATIATPLIDSSYKAGDTISFSGTATDPEDGDLPQSAFSWKIIFHHTTHVHPYLGPLTGIKNGTFNASVSSDNVSDTWYEIELTVTDSGGLEDTKSVFIYPNLVNLQIQTNVPGLQFTVDGIPHASLQEQAVVGTHRVLSVPSPQFLGGKEYEFLRWSDGGLLTHTITTPASDSAYTAEFIERIDPPSPWQSVDIGNPPSPGFTTLNDGVFSIKTMSGDVWGEANQFHFTYQELEGDGEIIARVVSQDNTDGWAKTGVMIKDSLTPSSPYAFMMVTPENGYAFQYTTTQHISGGEYTFPNAWVKLTRFGNTITAYKSIDGLSWQEVGTTTLAMQEKVLIGLASAGHHGGVFGVSQFDNVEVQNEVSMLQPVPNPWVSEDVGSPDTQGSASYADGVFTLKGAGSDIWGNDDQFQFVHQGLEGDGEVIARIVSQDNTSPWAKSGVMIKESTIPGSKYVFMGITPEHGYSMQYNYNVHEWGRDYALPNAWVKLVRSGNVFTAYKSVDGVTWEQSAPPATVEMGTQTRVGLFVVSQDASELNTTVFDNVQVVGEEPDPAPIPPDWLNQDIGSPETEGSASYEDGQFIIQGAGSDIWGSDDQFHYVYKIIRGDGEVKARIISQDNTSPWAKSGVMIKESTTSGSPYAFMGITPEHGYSFQYNYNVHEWGQDYTLPNAWVRIVRQGDTISAYKSIDGVTWEQVAQNVVIDMPEDVTFGMFVSSRNGSVLNTTVFDDVVVTGEAPGGDPEPEEDVPAPWISEDIGSPALTGSASFVDNIFTLQGAGIEIWGSNDQFHFVHQPMEEDGEIVARIVSQDNTSPWAKSGVMIKESTIPGSKYVFMGITPEHGYSMQYNYNVHEWGRDYALPNAWVKLVRSGNVFTAYKSVDGVTWEQSAPPATVEMGTSVRVGLFVTSQNGGQLNTSTFGDVSVTQ